MSYRIKLAFFCALLLTLTYSAYADIAIEINGIDGDAQRNVQMRLDLLRQSFATENETEQLHEIGRHVRQETIKALQPYGYFKPEVSYHFKKSHTNTTLVVDVLPGSALKISTIDLQILGTGQDNPKIQKYVSEFPLKINEVFKAEDYEKAKESLFQLANNQGYVQAFFATNKVLIDTKKNQAKIILHLQTGERYYFGRVMFDESAYADSFLRRLVAFKTDEPFSSRKLIELQQNLGNSYYVRQVLITPDFDHIEDHRVPIHVSLVAPKAKRFSLGIGYGSFTGPRLTAGASLRRVTDTGQHFDTQLKLSSVLSSLAAKYYIPGQQPLSEQWIIGGNLQKFTPENGSSESESISGGYLKKAKHYQYSANLNFLNERYSVKNHHDDHHSHLLYPSVNFNYTKVDDVIYPHFGHSLDLTLQGSSEQLLSSVSFIQGDLKGKYIFSPTGFSRVILKGEFGYTVVNDLKNLPLSMRFFAGGINSVRGYPDSGIGPGRYLETGSVEYQNHIVGNWNGAVFYDIGAATNDFNRHFKNGKGVGVIYDSFIGPIKLYLAKGKGYGVEFSIGPEF